MLGAYHPGPLTDDFVMFRKKRTRKSPTIGASVIIPRPSSSKWRGRTLSHMCSRISRQQTFSRYEQSICAKARRGDVYALGNDKTWHRAELVLTGLVRFDTLSHISAKICAEPGVVFRNALINPHDAFFLYLIITPRPDAKICVHRKFMLWHLDCKRCKIRSERQVPH